MSKAKKRYRVIGMLPVAGHVAGEEFEAAFDAFAEACLIAGGHIEVVQRQEPRSHDREEREEKEVKHG